jgi:uncharacterized membrane protein YvbJ
MYCANCGTQIKPGLNYCNRCGAKISRADLEARNSVSANLSGSLAYIGGFGLVGYIFILLILLKNDVHPAALMLLSGFYLVTLLAICFMILRHLKTAAPATANIDFQNNFQTGQLEAAMTAQLEEARQQPASVTEHTTRTLDKIESKF